MKSFKQMMAEVAEPKSPEEKRFKDQHAIQKIDHPAAEDSQFTGEITGKTKQKRLADQEGDADYDQAYSQRKDGKAKLESVEEDGEQIDEISKEMAARYLKKAPARAADAGDKVARASTAYDRATGKAQQKKGIRTFLNTNKGVERATNRLMKKEEVELSENPMEEKPMMMNALRTMSHNMQGIAAYVSKTPDPEEWFQNKLAGVAKEMQTLYGYATAETMAMGEAKTDEALKGDQHKLDVDKDGDIDGKDFKMLRKKKQKTESVELEEAVKQGNMKLRDGSSVKVSKQDAGLINQMMKDLNSANRRKMEKVMMTDKAGFEEIVGFAREAL